MLAKFLERWKNGKRLYAAFMGSPTPAAIVEPSGLIFAANRPLEKLLEYTDLELEGRHFREITDPRDLSADVAQFDLLTRGLIDSYQINKRWITKFDKVVKGELTVVPVYAPDGNQVEVYLAYVVPSIPVPGIPAKVERSFLLFPEWLIDKVVSLTWQQGLILVLVLAGLISAAILTRYL